MKKLSIAVTILLFGLTLAPTIVFGQPFDSPSANQGLGSGSTANQGLGSSPTANQGNCGGAIGGLTNPLCGTTSFCQLIKALLNIIILFGIPIATFFVMFAGFKLVMARGNPEALKRARLNLFYTMVGIAIFLGAWLLGQVIAGTIQSLNPNIPGLNNC